MTTATTTASAWKDSHQADEMAVPGTPYTRSQLYAAFTTVENADNWKMPIDKIVPLSVDIPLITHAVIFYTGSTPSFTPVMRADGMFLRVTAEGYYNTIGA